MGDFYRKTFTRIEALEALKPMNEDMGPGDEEWGYTDYSTMSNEELGAELCLSGTIHDDDFDKVVD